MKKSVLILQNEILHYRKPFYNELAKIYNLTILHSGKISVDSLDNYQEIITPVVDFRYIYLQRGVLKEVQSPKYDTIIAMADIRWISNIFAMFLHSKNSEFIWWGSWLTKSKVANYLKLILFTKHKHIFYSEVFKSEFLKRGVDSKKLFVANNTIDVGERFKSFESKEKNIILFVGSLNKRKQVDILINAFSMVVPRIPNKIELIIIGEGNEKSELRKLVNSLKIDERVSFLGRINCPRELSKYYKTAIVSVSFGQAGLSVLQSIGFGVPFLTKTNAISGGEKTNIINGVNGLFCENNLDSLIDALLAFCNNPIWSRELGKNAYNYYSSYCTIDNMVKGFINAIENNNNG